MGLVDDGSILMSIKRLLNIDPEEMAFDSEIGMLINGEFMTLHQLGIGPEIFSVHDANVKWSDYSDDTTLIEAVKNYVYLRVRLLFDPPASSVVSDAVNQRIAELQFRLNSQAERNWVDDSKSHYFDDVWADEEDACACANKKHYVLKGENLTLFESPVRIEGG